MQTIIWQVKWKNRVSGLCPGFARVFPFNLGKSFFLALVRYLWYKGH